MDRKGTYSLISVNADDDEEIVIQTGVARESAEKPGDGLPEKSECEEGRVEGDEPRAVFETEPEGEAAVASPPRKRRAPRAGEQRYRETTQEDLDSVEPMSKMQKIVLGCMVLLIVGFVVYYLFLR